MFESIFLYDWKDLFNWYVVSKDGFLLYWVINDIFKDKVINGNIIYIIVIVLMLKFVIRI